MAQQRRSTITRRTFLRLVGTFVLSLLLPQMRQQVQSAPIPMQEDQTGIFPFDLGASLLESQTAQVKNYDSKIFKQFLPFIRR